MKSRGNLKVNHGDLRKMAEELLSSEMFELKGGIVEDGGGCTVCSTCVTSCSSSCMVCTSTLGII